MKKSPIFLFSNKDPALPKIQSFGSIHLILSNIIIQLIYFNQHNLSLN